ncbi:MAG: hypothetical protein ABI867_26640 [Kofleriaceae bacterium]
MAWRAIVLVWLVGCVSLQSRAESAYQRANYLGAVLIYDQILAEHPADAAAIAQRERARNAALQLMVKRIDPARGDDAAEAVGRILDQRDAWRMTVVEVAPQITAAVATTTGYLDTRVRDELRYARPLSAEAVLVRHAAVLAHGEFAAPRDRLRAAVTDAGRATCAQLAADPSDPHWSWLADRYCAHWGDSPVHVPPLPHTRSGLVVEGALDGDSDADNQHLHATLAAGFRETAWFSPDAARVAEGWVGGKIAAAFSAHEIDLSKVWEEDVTYTDTETVSVSYDEPYDDTESYSEQVSHTNTDGSTSYSTEWKTRTVTKHRTAWRTEQKAVTKHRTDRHTYRYKGIERTGRYASLLSVRLLDLPEPIAASAGSETSKTGIDHDVTFAPASIVPQRANLETYAAYTLRQHDQLRARLVHTLDEQYAKQFCTRAQYTRDQAAACAYRDAATLPAPARATLRATFGGDEPLLAPLLRRAN